MKQKFIFLTLLCLFSCSFLTIKAQSLDISKSVDKTTVLSGETFTYTIQYACPSITDDCTGVTVVDALPAEVEFVSALGSLHTTGNVHDTGTNTVTFNFIEPLPAGSTGELQITVRFPNGSTPNNTLATNTADINATNAPSMTSNPVETTATATAKPEFEKLVPITPAQEGGAMLYEFRLCNDSAGGGSNGTLTITDIVMTDNLPVGTTFLYAEAGGVHDGGSPGTVTWTNPFEIPPGECEYIKLSLLIDETVYNAGDEIVNNASITYTPIGETPQTEPLVATTNIEPPTQEVYVRKTTNSTELYPGSSSEWEFTRINNTGNDTLFNFVVTDSIPENITVNSFSTGLYNYYILPKPTPTNSLIISYQTNLNATDVVAHTQVDVTDAYATINVADLGLAAGEYITILKYQFGDVPPGFRLAHWLDLPTISFTVNDDFPVPSDVTNCLSYTADNAIGVIPNAYPSNNYECVTTPVNELFAGGLALTSKGIVSSLTTNSGTAPFQHGDTIAFQIKASNITSATGNITNPILYDLLPNELTYIDATWYIPNWSNPMVNDPIFTQTDNYNGSGRSLLKWDWTGIHDLVPGDDIWIVFQTIVNTNALAGETSFVNEYYIDGDGINTCWGTEYTDTYDVNNNDDNNELLCGEEITIHVAAVPALESEKLVKGQLDTVWTKYPETGLTMPGGTADYQLYVRNVGTMPMTNVTVIDILPFIGDNGVIDTTPRGSLWRPNLVGAVQAPAGVTVYYSTSQNPCRDTEGIEPTGPAGCEAPNWTTTLPADISSIQSLKFDFGNIVINPSDELLLEWPMRAPVNAPTSGEIAWNSFGYIADRVLEDGSVGTPVLASEPIKVGIEIQPIIPGAYGDYVWVDTNLNGLQDDGATGLDGVRVELFKDNGDGIADPNTDTFVNFTLTANGGLYLFPNLPPDDYYAVFYIPPTYTATTPDANGGDETIADDSDGIVGTFNGQEVAIAPVTSLLGDELDDSWDLGLYNTAPPMTAIGNYVWFDENNDGIQNESALNGLNGITVNLYLDVDGDGIAEPNGDDGTPIATTLTTNDANGATGYYLFDDLSPDDYFVEFVLPTIATGFTTQGTTGSSDPSDSDADANGLTEVTTLEGLEYDATWDAGIILNTGNLSLGNLIWADDNNDGIYQPENGEVGINGVQLNLYVDTDANGVFTPNVDEFYATTTTATQAGNTGYYLFENLPAGDFIVQVENSNFNATQVLNNYISSTGNDPANDPDDNANNDDNGTALNGYGVVSQAISLAENDEPDNDGDTDNNSNLTVDFGFWNVENCTATPTALVEPTANICSENQGADEHIIDLQTLITSGDTNGSWNDDDATTGLSGSVFTYNSAMGAGPFTFTYTIAGELGAGNGACYDQTYTTIINIQNCATPCPTIDCVPIIITKQ